VALIPVCVGVFIAADDQTVVVTVLPRIMLDMNVPVTELDRASWTITGYLLGYLVAMPLIGRLSDVWGHRMIFVWSLVMFMIGSALVALTTSLDWLVATRVFQAVGAGALVPVSIAIVGDLFPPNRRGLPMGLIGASAEAGGVIGPLWAASSSSTWTGSGSSGSTSRWGRRSWSG
jgi:MFS family permease